MIGQLTLENEFVDGRSQRRACWQGDDRGHSSLAHCGTGPLLELSRSTVYYHPTLVSAEGLAVMRPSDELRLDFSGACSR